MMARSLSCTRAPCSKVNVRFVLIAPLPIDVVTGRL